MCYQLVWFLTGLKVRKLNTKVQGPLVCVCMCVYKYTYINTHVHTHIYIHTLKVNKI